MFVKCSSDYGCRMLDENGGEMEFNPEDISDYEFASDVRKVCLRDTPYNFHFSTDGFVKPFDINYDRWFMVSLKSGAELRSFELTFEEMFEIVSIMERYAYKVED